MDRNGRTQLSILAKFWRPGQVKTRLAHSVGDQLAADFHQACVMALIARFKRAAERCVAAVWPPEDLARFRAAIPQSDWTVTAQAAGDLGRKIWKQLTDASHLGVGRYVVIGADSPHVPREVIDQAFAALKVCDLVVGPSHDGGYYLIGARSELPQDFFNGINWGSDRVLAQTLERVEMCGVTCQLLETHFDVDTIDDLAVLTELLHSPTYNGPIWEPLRTISSACLAR